MKRVSEYSTQLVLLLFFFISNNGFASGGSQEGNTVSSKKDVENYILHHIKDVHDFHLFSYTNEAGERKHVGFPLPIILWTSNGLVTFMSSAFHHDDDGKVLVERNGLTFAKAYNKIYELDNGAETVEFDDKKRVINGVRVLDFSITKSVFGILFVGLLMLLAFSSLARQYRNKKVPTGFGRVLEPLVLYVRDEIARPNIG